MSQKKSVHSASAPEAIGPYSQAIISGNTVYLSGQIPLVPETMNLAGEDIETQTRQVFANLAAVAEAAGGSLEDLLKMNIYLTNLDHFAIVNDIMSELLSEPYPARATVQVSALPRGAGIEIDGILALPV